MIFSRRGAKNVRSGAVKGLLGGKVDDHCRWKTTHQGWSGTWLSSMMSLWQTVRSRIRGRGESIRLGWLPLKLRGRRTKFTVRLSAIAWNTLPITPKSVPGSRIVVLSAHSRRLQCEWLAQSCLPLAEISIVLRPQKSSQKP